jgi:hypothetical protein
MNGPDSSTHRSRSQLTALIYLAGTIDMKQAKLDQSFTVTHQAQLRSQLTDLIGKFQKQYAEWLKSGEEAI